MTPVNIQQTVQGACSFAFLRYALYSKFSLKCQLNRGEAFWALLAVDFHIAQTGASMVQIAFSTLCIAGLLESPGGAGHV